MRRSREFIVRRGYRAAGGAAGGARLLGLNEQQVTSAIALAANTTVGFNQWAHTGGSEMFFQAGFAARNAVTSVRLAEAGAFASPSALDGEGRIVRRVR
jgi:2-methylcitrate dehydratase PrpD